MCIIFALMVIRPLAESGMFVLRQTEYLIFFTIDTF